MGIGLAVENKLNPSVPVFEKVAPVIAPVGTVIGANMLLDSMNMLNKKPRQRRR